MKRVLALVIGDPNDLYNSRILPLIIDEQEKIDDFTIKLENSEQIREKFKKQIESFLEKNQDILKKIKHKRGNILLLEPPLDDEYTYRILRVLYKKHLIAYKELVFNGQVMRRAAKMEKIGVTDYGYKKLMSDHLFELITKNKYNDSNAKNVRRAINYLHKNKEQKFYDILRIVVSAYEKIREERKQSYLPTIEQIYARYKYEKRLKNIKIKHKKEEEKSLLEQLESERKVEIYDSTTGQMIYTFIDENGQPIDAMVYVGNPENKEVFEDGQKHL